MPEHTDNSEAMDKLPHKLHTLIRSLPQAPFREHLAAEFLKQAERIAELEARVHTCGPTCSKAGCINRRVTAERDQLRAEVERTSNNRDMWKGQCERQAEQLAQMRAKVERLNPNAERWEWVADGDNFDDVFALLTDPKLTIYELTRAVDAARTRKGKK